MSKDPRYQPYVDERGIPRCGAMTRAADRHPCRNRPEPGMTRCKNHGGRTPVGEASPHYIDGRTRKSERHRREKLGKLAAAYDAALADVPNIIDLTEDIALIDARVDDLLGRQSGIAPEQVWRDLGRAFHDFMAARARKDKDGNPDIVAMHEHLDTINRLIGQGRTEAAAWAEIIALKERRRRIAETEMKRRVAAASLVPLADVDRLLNHVMGLIQRHVPDEKAVRAISDGVIALIAPGGPR